MRRLYHATIGEAGNIAEQFSQGARSNVSQGNGQGHGFYLWTNQEGAEGHLKFLREQGATGTGVLLEFNESPQVDEWDIDHEVHPDSALGFLHNNLGLLSQIPDGAVNTARGPLLSSQTRISDLGTVVLSFGNEKGRRTLALSPASVEGSIGYAQVIGEILEYLEGTPELYSARENWLSRPDLQALKYRGKKLLAPARFHVIGD